MNEFTKITQLRIPANGDFSGLSKDSDRSMFCYRACLYRNCDNRRCKECIFGIINGQYFRIWIEKYYMGGRK